MKALQSFEAWLTQMLEDGLGAMLGAGLQPIDIANRLGQYMEDHRTVGAGRRYVPNAYRVYLAPRTLAGFESYRVALQDELAAFLQARAREIDARLVGRVHVELLPDEKLKPERMRIDADLVEKQVEEPSGQIGLTRPIAVEGPGPAAPAPVVLVVGGRRVMLSGTRPVSIGRALDNDVVVDHSTVSRHHARLSARGNGWLLEDTGSTNGSFVNDGRVSRAYVRCGDSIRVGSITMLLTEVTALDAAPGGAP